jgi:hypothetical protein
MTNGSLGAYGPEAATRIKIKNGERIEKNREEPKLGHHGVGLGTKAVSQAQIRRAGEIGLGDSPRDG